MSGSAASSHGSRADGQAPLRGEPRCNRRGDRGEPLLDAAPAAMTGDAGVDHASVLVDLAEQVLDVDQLQRAAPQAREFKPEPPEVLGLVAGGEPDDFGFDTVSGRAEAFPDAVARTWPGDHEVHLAEVDRDRVVQVDAELIAQEVAERREK